MSTGYGTSLLSRPVPYKERIARLEKSRDLAAKSQGPDSPTVQQLDRQIKRHQTAAKQMPALA